MSLKTTLGRLMRVVLDEAERNPAFEAALMEALDPVGQKARVPRGAPDTKAADSSQAKRGKNRRTAAAIDPVQIVREGEQALRSALEGLTLEQLRDIVAEYGMDPGRLVMKWNTTDRVIDRIVEMSIARAQKGSAFRRSTEEGPPAPSADDVTKPDSQSTGKAPPLE